jgi:hypothetical protein
MGRPKKPVIPTVDPKDVIYYYASSEAILNSHDEIYPEPTIDKAISYLREQEDELDEVFIFEIKMKGHYKTTFTLEEIK